jgi:hypothetical protein
MTRRRARRRIDGIATSQARLSMGFFGEYRRLALAGTVAPFHAPVLLVGFQRTGESVRQFRTQTEEGERGAVPPLDVILGDPSTMVVPIVKGARNPYGDFVFVGRGSTSDIILTDASVSKSHAAFQLDGGRWFVKDNKARNGTFVDGLRLEPGSRASLATGAQITFGAYGTYFIEPEHFARLVKSEHE